LRSFAAEHFKQPAWGYSHSSRDYALARDLAASDGVTIDDDVLFAAAYLHDMAAFEPWADPNADHADVAARLVHTVLEGTGFPMAKRLEDNLAKVPDRAVSPAGRAMVPARKAELENFLQDLKRESADLENL